MWIIKKETLSDGRTLTRSVNVNLAGLVFPSDNPDTPGRWHLKFAEGQAFECDGEQAEQLAEFVRHAPNFIPMRHWRWFTHESRSPAYVNMATAMEVEIAEATQRDCTDKRTAGGSDEGEELSHAVAKLTLYCGREYPGALFVLDADAVKQIDGVLRGSTSDPVCAGEFINLHQVWNLIVTDSNVAMVTRTVERRTVSKPSRTETIHFLQIQCINDADKPGTFSGARRDTGRAAVLVPWASEDYRAPGSQRSIANEALMREAVGDWVKTNGVELVGSITLGPTHLDSVLFSASIMVKGDFPSKERGGRMWPRRCRELTDSQYDDLDARGG